MLVNQGGKCSTRTRRLRWSGSALEHWLRWLIAAGTWFVAIPRSLKGNLQNMHFEMLSISKCDLE